MTESNERATPVKKQMVSPQQAAELLGVNRDTVRRWIKRGKLKATKFTSSTIRIPMAEVERMIREHAA